MKDDKNDMNNIGIRSDRFMTPLEVHRAAENYKAVKRATEETSSPGIIEWILMGIAVLMIVVGILFY